MSIFETIFVRRGDSELNRKFKQWSGYLLMASMLFACQSIPESTSQNNDVSDYYLWLTTLNNVELTHEINSIKNNRVIANNKVNIQLVLLYSLPNSPIYNPYTAKAKLNLLDLSTPIDSSFSEADLAFITMLKDQLNQQLLQLEQMNNYKGAYKQSKQTINAQQQTISTLNKQIVQLKNIEKNINERGQ